jgi:hypothetical protein
LALFALAAFLLHVRTIPRPRRGADRTGRGEIGLLRLGSWRIMMVNWLLSALLLTVPTAPVAEASAEMPRQEAPEQEEEVICRRRLIPSERVGERFRRQEVCMTREEWEAERRRR